MFIFEFVWLTMIHCSEHKGTNIFCINKRFKDFLIQKNGAKP